jgi:Ner family transcriptional regulator
MNYETIKTELGNKGYSMSMIAAALKCTPVNVHQVCKRSNSSYRVANAVATALECQIIDVFPDVPSYQNVKVFNTSREERIEALQQRLAG